MDAAGIRSAVGLASANLDTQLSGIDSKTTNLPSSPAAVGSLMGLADGAITAAKFASGAIDANAIATDAFGALEVAAGAASEIAAAVRTELTTELGRIDVAVSSVGMSAAGSDVSGTPSPTDSYGEKIDWLYALSANEQTQSRTLQTVASSDGTVVSEAVVSSNGTTVTREAFANP